MITAIAFIFGTIFGSFLNMLLWRLPRSESIGGRSRCPVCGRALSWFDLVPILSFFILRGRCRRCHSRIPTRYPVVELTSGAVLAAIAQVGPPPGMPLVLAFLAALVLVGVLFFDLYHFLIPDAFILPAVVTFGTYVTLWRNWQTLLSGFGLAAFFAILYLASKGRRLGFGDVKLSFLIGLMFGWPIGLLVTVGGIWLGAAWGLLLLVLGRATGRTPLPFGSFLSAASIYALIFHETFGHLAAYFR